MVSGGIGTYRLYTLTDYMHLSNDSASWWMSFMAAASLPFNIIFCLVDSATLAV